MLKNVSRLVLTKFTAMGLSLLAAGAGALAQTPVAPVLIPYTSTLIAGNPATTTGGYNGDGNKAAGTDLNGPSTIAVDAEGNVYIADETNAVIREVNAETGLIKIIAGLPPNKCNGTLCSAQSGYTDNVPATSAAIGTGLRGVAVDGFGNVFFCDYGQNVIRVIYKGGTQVANLIALEDPTAAPTASAVVPGNIYLIAGSNGAKGSTDKVLATKGSMHDPTQLQLDAAGNIYFEDFGNDVIRVINAQSTTQTFFGVSLAPGFMGAIVNCGTITLTCGSQTVNGQYYTGVPAGAANYGAGLANQALGVDAAGNVYEVNTKGAASIFAGVAYNGQGPLSKLLPLVINGTPVPGDFYNVINGNPANTSVPAIALSTPFPMAALANEWNNIVLRATAITIDAKGNIYYLDNHYPWIFRVDVNTQVATRLTGFTATAGGTATTPSKCNFTAGAAYTPTESLGVDNYGDGCPAVASISTAANGVGAMATDAAGDLFLVDTTDNAVREFSVNSQFPPTALGTSTTQTLQVHFDQTNLPLASITSAPTTNAPLAIQTGDTDFAIATAPTCTSNTVGVISGTSTGGISGPLDGSIECWVQVSFTPTGSGRRTGTLQATVSSGAVYNIGLSGIGNTSELALDGGTQNVITATGLGPVTDIAVDAIGDKFIADPANNQVVELPVNGAQTTIGTGLKAPHAVAVDAAGNVYIADTGNNRIVKVPAPAAGEAGAGTQAVLGSGFSGPQGIAVDQSGNVYVADTGNKQVVEIPGDSALAQATLFQFPSKGTGAPILQTPVAVAVDSLGNVYVADQGVPAVYEIAPGGGDLQTVVSSSAQLRTVPGGVQSPNGLAVDAAGNVYISDSKNNVVVEAPSSTGPGAAPFNLSFSGLSSPAGLALDPSGNLYVADPGNTRALEMNRTAPTVSYGQLGVFQPALAANLTVSNIGNQNITLNSPAFATSGATNEFTLADSSSVPCGGTVLFAGLTCTLNSTFLPTAAGVYAETVALQGGASNGGITATITGTGVAPLAAIVTTLSVAPVTGGTAAQATATVTQPHGVNTPTGTVTFVYTVNEGNTARGGSTTTVTVPLVSGSGGAATAQLNLTGLLPARRYSIVATYNGDPGDSANTAAPLTFIVPGGTTLTVVANPVSFTYGSAVPTITGTVTGILPADAANITYTFTTTATSTTNIGTYPISLLLSGGNYLNYVVPPAVTSTGAPALVTENPAPLTISVANVTSVYGSQNVTYVPTFSGLVPNVTPPSVQFTPAYSSGLDVGTYPIVPIVTGGGGNYSIKLVNGTLTITPAATSAGTSANASSLLVTLNGTAELVTIPGTGVAANAAAVLPTNLSSEQLSVVVASSTTGTPAGTVTLTDTFTPFSTGTPAAPVTIGPLTLTAVPGTAQTPSTTSSTTYTPTSTVPGIHSYTVSYSGSLDYAGTTDSTPIYIVVDSPDFFLVAPTSPLVVVPGVIPGGNSLITGESSSDPEQATVTLTPTLNYTGTITLSCSSPSSYVSCGFTNIASTSIQPTISVVLNTTSAQTTTINVQTPATLPTNSSAGLRLMSRGDYVLAMLPFGILALLPLARGRRKLRRYVWLLALFFATGFGLTGCTATNLVKFYTPVPEGVQNLTITATDGTITKTFVMQITIQ